VLSGKRILAVVPARGGSKGVPLKNIRPLHGLPLVAHVAPVVRELGYFDRAIVSTDDPEIARIAVESGLDAPFFRPEALSGDQIGDLDVLEHSVLELERLDGVRYDIVVMLQPTSPLRRPKHVDQVVRKLLEGWDAVWTVGRTPSTYHPAKQLVVSEDESMSYYEERGAQIIARQQLEPTFHRNGAAYAFTRACLLEQRTIMGIRTTAVVMDDAMISIDTVEDFDRVGQLLDERP
jgi:CMP-N,N'-diacetyllegionaminic acid synthase